MPASQQEKVPVPCPHCGHSQKVPRTAVTTVCKECGGHFPVQELLKPKVRKAAVAPEKRHIVCFDCGTELAVPKVAESTMCKRCSAHIDLRDYHIANAVSRNFRTKGIFVVEPKGYVFNTEAIVGEAVLKGKFLGKLKAEGSLTIHSSAEIKGSFTAGQLIIPAKNRFYWKEPVTVGAAEIAGEIAADVIAAQTIVVKSTGVLFGNIQARNLIVEPGAVLVGNMRIGESIEKPAAIGTKAELSG
jgi:cytoskeletal protein CcmA (bactofilin family)